jgi:hypothetical protein
MISAVNERSHQYKDIKTLKKTIKGIEVQESASFSTRHLALAGDGLLHSPQGKHRLTTLGLSDVLELGGIGSQAAKRFLRVGLENVVLNAVNEYFVKLDKQVKLILRNELVVAVPSSAYLLIPNQTVVEHVLDHLPSGLILKSAILCPESMRVVFTNPSSKRIVKFSVDDVTQVGIGVVNSETRHSALRIFGYLHRLICENGTILGEQFFNQRWVHRQQEKPVLNGDFAAAMGKTVEGVYNTAPQLMALKKKTVSNDFLYQIQQRLFLIIGKKSSENLLAPFRHTKSLYDIYNAITQHAHKTEDEEKIRDLQRLGGWIVLNNN